MSADLRGAHHMIGVSHAVVEMLFQILQARCVSGGGRLSREDLDGARAQLTQTMPRAAAFFESMHQRCMEASGATAPALVDSRTILGSLLYICGQKAARHAFTHQVTRFGDPWLRQFFGGLAEYARQHFCTNVDARLMRVYVAIAWNLGPKLSIDDLMHDEATRNILRECTAPMITTHPDALAHPLSDLISQEIASARGIPRPDISKVTEQEVKLFLKFLPPQLQIALGTGQAKEVVA